MCLQVIGKVSKAGVVCGWVSRQGGKRSVLRIVTQGMKGVKCENKGKDKGA